MTGITQVLRAPRLRLTGLVIGIVAISAATALGYGLFMLTAMGSNVDELGEHGESLALVGTLKQSATRSLLFASEERSRLTAGERAVPEAEVISMNMVMQGALATVAHLETTNPRWDADLGARIREMQASFLAYLNSNLEADLARLDAAARAAEARATQIEADEAQVVPVRFERQRSLIGAAKWALLPIALFILPLPVFLIWWMSRRYDRALRVSGRRETSLALANRAMERRNGQFQALYQVVSEVNETLSLKYIGRTAVHEARRLVEADLAVLRVLESTTLRVVDCEGDIPDEHEMRDIELGEGLVGRAARRGKTARVEAEAPGVASPDGHPQGRSGLIVPLIVGARVVGTLSCWSQEDNKFNEDDLQMLELMASQVATAIAAADTHEASDRDAHRDALTGLANRRQLVQDAKYEYDAAVRRGRRLSVAMVDIDHFKRFNDAHGHQAGDIALQHVAGVLASHLRPEDRIYRYGGEEFAIVFDTLPLDQVSEACERLRRAVEQEAVPRGEGAKAKVTISIGVASSPEMADEFAALLGASDEALYRSKEGGRNQVTIFGTALDDQRAAA